MWVLLAAASGFVVPLRAPQEPLRRVALSTWSPAAAPHLSAQRFAALRLAMREDTSDGASPRGRDQPRGTTPCLAVFVGALAGFAGRARGARAERTPRRPDLLGGAGASAARGAAAALLAAALAAGPLPEAAFITGWNISMIQSFFSTDPEHSQCSSIFIFVIFIHCARKRTTTKKSNKKTIA